MTPISARQALAAWLPAALAGLVGLGCVVPIANAFNADRTLVNYCVSPMFAVVAIAVTLLWLHRRGDAIALRDQPEGENWWWMAALGLGALASSGPANWTIDRLWDLAPGPSWVLGNPASYRGEFPLDVTGALVLYQLLVRIPLTVVTEEILFRGYLQPRLGRHGLLIASLLFAAYHTGQWWTIVQLVPFGFALGIVRQKTGSVVPGMVLHYLGNAAYLLSAL